MSVFLAPTFGDGYQAFDTVGQPLNGGLIYTYQAGTTTPQATFTTSSGNVQNANPIVCGTDGRPQSAGAIVEIWLTSGLTYKFVLTDSLNNTIATYDNLPGINDVASSGGTTNSEWIATGLTPTFISTTSFSFVGNQTGNFPVGIRTKTVNTGGTIYSNVVSATYSAGPNTTTIVVTNDSGVIDSGINAVSYGLLRSDNESLPPFNTLLPVLADSTDPTKRVKFNAASVSTGTIRTLTIQDRNGTVALSGDAQINGASRRARMTVTAVSSATATFLADEVTLETALSGNSMTIASVTLPINLGATGAGGMDSGVAPPSGFVALYGIAKIDGTQNILACNSISSATSVYGGAFMPAGFTYSALVGVCPTDTTAKFLPGALIDRRWMYTTFPTLFTAHATIGSLTSQSVTSAVPVVARTVSLYAVGTAAAGLQFAAAGDAGGTGGSQFIAANSAGLNIGIGGAVSGNASVTLKDVPLLTSQIAFIAIASSGSANNLHVSDYTF